MFLVERLPFSALIVATLFSIWELFRLVWYRPLYQSPLRYLQGPKRANFIIGNVGEMMEDENSALVQTWVKAYGNTMRIKGFFNSNRLLTVDTRAIHHVLAHPDAFQKAATTRHTLGQIFGEGGLLVVEDKQYRQQRRVMNPAFGPAQIRALTETFFDKAIRLRDLWSSEIANDPTTTITGTRVDAALWLSKVTLDVIGLAGFNYDFGALESSKNPSELGEAFTTMFLAAQGITVFDVFRVLFPALRLIPYAKARQLEAAQRTMTRIGKELLTHAKAAALANVTGNGKIDKSSLLGRDLLSLLVKANMATDLYESQKLSDKDVIAQVPTFLVAGHETTSVALCWALFSLTQAPEVQRKLRDELLSVDTDAPSMDELMALPYLDAVLRETLRLHPPVPSTERIAMKDDVLPVEKPYTDKYGAVRKTIPIAKGEKISIQIQTMNLSKEIWGPDAVEFKPERWDSVPAAASQMPGVWGNLLTFLGGPRACIGHRFSLVESKAILFTLLRAFEFELAVPASQIGTKTDITQRPILRGDPTCQGQLPLLLRPYQRT